ncbi:MAG TPA: hypothetical protein PLM80_02215 [Mesotoga sp.]|nr:hypothetical protein [Mesotoga sp.]MDI9374682.1 hypothetical protein [Thermotogota bacterium]NLX34289.1 hypothetical protein [Thermotogaceae bacterium]MDD4039518.1 hypothetical protein [Mesotoga sp.]MDD5743956.1 hypothetical protein [Mesotoga sp.]
MLAVLAMLISSGIALILQYRSMSATLEISTNLHSAKLLVEGIVRSANRVSEENIIDRIEQLSNYPGFQDVEVASVEATNIEDSPTRRIFEVVLRDRRVGVEEVFHVFRFDPFAE